MTREQEEQQVEGVMRLIAGSHALAAGVSAQALHREADEVHLSATVKNGQLESLDIVLMRKGQPLGGFGQ